MRLSHKFNEGFKQNLNTFTVTTQATNVYRTPTSMLRNT